MRVELLHVYTDFKVWAVIGFSIAHQCPPAIDFACVAMEGSHTRNGYILARELRSVEISQTMGPGFE